MRTAPTAPPRRRAGSVLTRCDSGDCITRQANASAHPRCSAMPRGANTVCPDGLGFGHHPSKHMAPHASGALHARTQLCSRHADRQGHSGRTPHVNNDSVGESCVCLADAFARGQTTAHSHAQQLRVRSGQRTHRVWLCAIMRKKTARTRRGRNAHMHVAGLLPTCATVCGTTVRTRRAAGRTTPPTTEAHPMAAGVPEGVAPAPAAPASRAASPACVGCIPAPGRADAR